MEKNIYIENHEEIKRITLANGTPATVETQLDIFENNHGIKKDLTARAQYVAMFRPNDISQRDFELLTPQEQEAAKAAAEAFKKKLEE